MAGWECGDAATPAARAATHSRVFVRRLTFVRGVVAASLLDRPRPGAA